MKITVEAGDKNARLIGKILFVLGGFFILMALMSVATTSLIFPSFILTVIGGILLLSGLFLMMKI
ncbi:MAG: hypothetical protein GW779_02145 [Candidatus Altiarchaeum hamiconexum]|uniref:Uncharacterized protein n=1 Tax=Candidatus Altarchaeum hamiconexum TaxID=1803513 RepID=A0A8J7YSB1_9ARCH|nr:hypothetical protein [Candidatus Altarchaeum hamiconexum]OIQ04988.1 MAG: hypothetical protein AUK59_05600 [Candidatus Altarchaeum sp. CG2_30_32_3053]PIN67530.1 MAG: hypothetical protein COV98_02520 [Candidatus Altarchaeum sp. CG12_big_fil_rev_8_21_14_0_65_33_22]PIV28996.1 MAG: hypothetical protein COS36_00135 [Candidatus Altarchaeum sp. CG03_land_8_20_14_0_80_32_618]PIX49440.1 MAG: hypothetical protein COZ53_00610 [Candidatus Altarchaeum sp. CG_4_8_14_3_um_filter_33_2054]PIZ32080.1 MAG: hyp